MYDYFRLGDNEQYLFLQLPWLLIKDAQFKRLSDSSKILYGLLLNRTVLSSKNGWVDEQGYIYIIYTIEQIMDDLCCATEKATKTLKELKDIGLVKSVRQGLGKPNLIYVMNFATSHHHESSSNLIPTQNFGNRNSRVSETEIQESRKIEIQEFRKPKRSNTNISDINVSNIDIKSMSMSVSEENKPDADMTMTSTYENLIKENIEYDYIAQGVDRDFIDGLVQVMIDVILTEAPPTVKIGKEYKNRETVKNVYLKLNSAHISHVVAQYKEQHHRINHKTSYLRTMLYTCYQEFDAYYTNAVRADGVVW